MTETECNLAQSPTSPVALELRGITKRFSGVSALADVNFTLHAGEVVALLLRLA